MSSSFGRYGNDVPSSDSHRRGDFAHNPESRSVETRRGLVVEDVDTGFVGEIVRISKAAGQWQVELGGRKGVRRSFPLGRGFWIDGRPVELIQPQAKAPVGEVRTVSGSFHTSTKTRTTRESRIWIEGKHDAELVAKIWGADLALEDVVIEEFRRVDRLEECLAGFFPSSTRRAEVLADHPTRGSKEQRITECPSAVPGILILGHSYADVWRVVRPVVLGLREQPEVPCREDIKVGTLKRLGWPHTDVEDIGPGWTRTLEKVMVYKDSELDLLGYIEELIDFVTEDPTEWLGGASRRSSQAMP